VADVRAGALATGAAAFGGLVAAGGLDTGIDLMGLAVMEPTMQLAGALAVGGFMARNVLFAEDRKRLLSQYKVGACLLRTLLPSLLFGIGRSKQKS
jgi:hypothetical protein